MRQNPLLSHALHHVYSGQRGVAGEGLEAPAALGLYYCSGQAKTIVMGGRVDRRQTSEILMSCGNLLSSPHLAKQ